MALVKTAIASQSLRHLFSDSQERRKGYIDFGQYLREEKTVFDANWESTLYESRKLDEFCILKTLSEGAFGKVALVRDNTNVILTLIAIKIMDKAHIVKTKQVAHTHNEIKVMDSISFPFLISLTFFFKNNCYLFLGMPYINGGELFTYLRREKKLSESQTKFYAAQMILAFEYLHFMGIVYRDLKPENILLDDQGYLKLTDYGFCKKINENRTWTLCGTPEYLAPEVILGCGYNKSIDWWTMGILIFEMASGVTPFFNKETLKMYEKIIQGRFQFPLHFSFPLRQLISGLLNLDKSKRLGALKDGSKDIKMHEFFKALNWDDVFCKKIRPAYKPSLSGPEDTSKFSKVTEFVLRQCETEEFAEQFNVIQVNN